MVALGATRQLIATYYGTLGNWFAACTGNPGTSSTVANETSGAGGSGAYQRLQGTWSSGSTGSLSCTNVILSVPAATFTFGALCSAQTGAAQLDNAAITSTVFAAPGQLVFTPSYAQT